MLGLAGGVKIGARAWLQAGCTLGIRWWLANRWCVRPGRYCRQMGGSPLRGHGPLLQGDAVLLWEWPGGVAIHPRKSSKNRQRFAAKAPPTRLRSGSTVNGDIAFDFGWTASAFAGMARSYAQWWCNSCFSWCSFAVGLLSIVGFYPAEGFTSLVFML